MTTTPVHLRHVKKVEPPNRELVGQDNFNGHAAGPAPGLTAQKGGVWTEYGDLDDFTINSGELVRDATGDASAASGGQFLRLGTGSYAHTLVYLDMHLDEVPTATPAGAMRRGCFARFTDGDNWLMLAVTLTDSPGTWGLELWKRIAGAAPVSLPSLGVFYQATAAAGLARWVRFLLEADAEGNVTVREGIPGQALSWVADVNDSDLAATGPLSSGGIGVYDANASSEVFTRRYDNFEAYRVNSDPALREIVRDFYMRPQDRRGINGPQGWKNGSQERRLLEEGRFTIVVPNDTGQDGILHRERFLISRTVMEEDPKLYRPGEEWIEVYEGDQPHGDLLFVGTPDGAEIKDATVELRGYDALGLMKKQRETAAGDWSHSPRDVFEHYLKAWRVLHAQDFEDPSSELQFIYSSQIQAGHGFTYRHCERTGNAPGAVRVRASSTTPDGYAMLRSLDPVDSGIASSDTCWRIEVGFSGYSSNDQGEDVGVLRFGLGTISGVETSNPNPIGPRCCFALIGHKVYIEVVDHDHDPEVVDGVVNNEVASEKFPLDGSSIVLTIEGRDRWVYFYVNGALVGISERPTQPGITMYPFVHVFGTRADQNGDPMRIDVGHFLSRVLDDFLGRPGEGDLRLPGSPTPGGLYGTYFDDRTKPLSASRYNLRNSLRPNREPTVTRNDPVIDFDSGVWAAWAHWEQNNGLEIDTATNIGTNFSARWVGAIFLDLDNNDYQFRVRVDDRARLWIGKTFYPQSIIDDWTLAGHATLNLDSGWMKGGASPVVPATDPGVDGPLAGQKTGWYPIRLEYSQGTGASVMQLMWRTEAGETAFVVVPGTSLSPYGCFVGEVRHESHYDVLTSLSDSFGYQYVCEPRPFEDERFPGIVVPKVRVGRDTDYVLDQDKSTERSVGLAAGETVDTLLADASGIADPDGGAQLTAEMLNFGQLENASWFTHTEYESLSEISERGLLIQRLQSLLALRSNPWEEVSARPIGSRRKLTDSFPLTGELAEFHWEPGDGVRLDFPRLGVKDQSPRQMLGISYDLVPDGLASPSASFRQRPRGFREVLRKLIRETRNPQRNYQGQLAIAVGTHGVSNSGGGINDSVIPLPNDISKVVRAELVVLSIVGGSWDVLVNGVVVPDMPKISAPGRYDITRAVARTAAEPNVMSAGLTMEGPSDVEYQLELLVRV